MKKIISSILAASFIFAACAMNVMAAPTERTLSVKTTPATELKSGDTVTVEVVLDKTLGLFSADYTLSFDPAVFDLNTTKVSKLESYIDSTWYATSGDGIRNAEGDFAYYLGNPTKNASPEEGWIFFGWSGDTNAGEGVSSEDAKTDRVIGKFYLTVKSVPASGSSELTITGHTGGYKENTGDTVTTVPATVTFKSSEPTATPWEVTITEEPAQAHGYIWKVDTTKGDGDLTKFDVTFTDDTPETFERSILSATKDAYNWNAPTSFYVGLYTTRTGVTADWKAASTKDGKVIEATIK